MEKYVDPVLLNKTTEELKEFIKGKRVWLKYDYNGLEVNCVYNPMWDGGLLGWIEDDSGFVLKVTVENIEDGTL